MTIVALDAMGGDFAPAIAVEGALQARSAGVDVVLVGDEAAIAAELERHGARDRGLRVVHAPDAIGMHEHAAAEVRRRRESSIYVATELVKRGEAQAVVSMGNTGAAMATALIVLGRLAGVERPALAAILPTPAGPTLLMDVGANAEARPAHLVQFAEMGSAYLRAVHGIAHPRVGLLSIGEEASKGSPLVVEANARLAAAARIDFAGNVEGRDIVGGTVDLVVTDGFTGNVALKLLEGATSMMLEQLRAAAGASLLGRAGGALLMPALREMRARFDYRRYGGVPLLGVDGAVFVGHGRSDALAVANALRAAADAVEHDLLATVARAVQEGAPQGDGADAGSGGSADGERRSQSPPSGSGE